ncbi:hypothetical protein CDD80_5370 [Ophiocordyceps camponoti-rufipedis]|uniref:Glutamyl-tRNA(Gln) amidotransferase subunit B, mitochondrial n=1 Tax=Ophiocordyceps camponoti-rufipedis TaxID=2004952 RepID=A0A2C5YP47_9HYPO|nr:hypothetical protein CDD80_5370 [Ophiocordyceps camponoti-rufipedis]
MRRLPVSELRAYLLRGTVSPPRGCLTVTSLGTVRHLHTASQPLQPPVVPLRKQLREEARRAKKEGSKKRKTESQVVDGWELTVGIEIHAQLNTARKLFSDAFTSFNDEPNSHVALFDVAMPGSQPLLNKEVLLPALRASLALNCDVQRVSCFDRKHYFWWDQPAGYQITQYYKPLARNGHITLYARDGIAPEDGESITVGIRQIQLEQDTAKTLAQADKVHWLDFNRVGVPLVEIITEPDLHHPRTAAIFVRKVQLMLSSVDACVSGMEAGGLRADVNVSVRRVHDPASKPGVRTEIKNLSTIKAVEDAIIAERDRQIRELEAGGVIAGETRGWTIGAKETRRLRGKEGEVDYRYMPDPDIAPLIVADDLVDHVQNSLAILPDAELDLLVGKWGLTAKDAMSLLALDTGSRVQYFYRVVSSLGEKLAAKSAPGPAPDLGQYAPLAGNWILHELGRVTAFKSGSLAEDDLVFTPEGDCARVPISELSQLLFHLYCKHITGKVAKELLLAIYLRELDDGVQAAIEANDLWFKELSADEYAALADSAMEGEEKVLREFGWKEEFPQGKLMFLVGKMIRLGPAERIEPMAAREALKARIRLRRSC